MGVADTMFNGELNSKIPSGKLADKWTDYRSSLPLVSPANKQKQSVIIVGTGLAGASAAASLSLEQAAKNKIDKSAINFK